MSAHVLHCRRNICNRIIDGYRRACRVVVGKRWRYALRDAARAILWVTILDDGPMGVAVARIYRVRPIGRLALAQRLKSADPGIVVRQPDGLACLGDPRVNVAPT